MKNRGANWKQQIVRLHNKQSVARRMKNRSAAENLQPQVRGLIASVRADYETREPAKERINGVVNSLQQLRIASYGG
jgi:hypothetical protein